MSDSTSSWTVRLPKKLDASQAALSTLSFVGTETTPGGTLFVYEPTVTTALPMERARESAEKTLPGDTATELPAKPLPQPNDAADDDDDDMQVAVDVTVTRLMKKCEKNQIAALCADFGISVSGTKEDLAMRLAEQLLYETDDDEDEDEDDQGGDEGDDLEKAFALISVNELDDCMPSQSSQMSHMSVGWRGSSFFFGGRARVFWARLAPDFPANEFFEAPPVLPPETCPPTARPSA